MDMHTRRRKIYNGFAEIADVINDVLREAETTGSPGLNAPQVTEACGLNPEGPERYVIDRLLDVMAADNEVYNQSTAGPGSWRLTTK